MGKKGTRMDTLREQKKIGQTKKMGERNHKKWWYCLREGRLRTNLVGEDE